MPSKPGEENASKANIHIALKLSGISAITHDNSQPMLSEESQPVRKCSLADGEDELNNCEEIKS